MRPISFVLFLTLALPAAAGEWCSSEASVFTFETTFEGEVLPGDFPDFDVRYSEGSALRVNVDLTAADMGDPDMNDVLADPAWFDTATFMEAVFESDGIDESDNGDFVAEGTLDLKGVEQPIAVPFAWSNSGDGATMKGELSLRRTDFDVGSGEWSTGESIGLDVRLVFDVKLERCD